MIFERIGAVVIVSLLNMRKLSSKRLLATTVALAFVGITSMSVLALNQGRMVYDFADRRADKAAADLQQLATNGSKLQAADSTNDANKPSPTPTKPSAISDSHSAATNVTNTPGNQTSFTTVITHMRQVTTGTLISYNATTSTKTYYGGDLVPSVATMTISKGLSTQEQRTITISSPDDTVITAPQLADDDHSLKLTLDQNTTTSQESGSTFSFVINLNDTQPGTYTLHIVSEKIGSTDKWQYDGFVAISVVE